MEQIARKPVDLVITDIFMPTMDGFELLSALRKRYPDSKMIAMSGGGATMSQTLALRVAKKIGAIGFIRKPFQLNDVTNMVNMAIGSAQPAARNP